MKRLSNESGITLIEVLAAITITTIIGSVVYGVLFQSIHVRDKTQAHIDLRQEANIAVTQLRTMHENGETIWYSADMIYTDQNLQNPLSTKENYHFTKVAINSSQLVTGNSIVLAKDKTFNIQFTISDKSGNEYELKTIIAGNSNVAIDVTVNKPKGLFPPKPNPIGGCIDATKTNYNFPNVTYPTTCVNGISNISSTQAKTVNGTLYVDGNLTLDNGNQGQGETTLTVNNNGTNGDLIVTGTLTILNHTLVDVTNGKAYFNNVTSQPNASMTITGDTYIFGSLAGLAQQTPICIQGTLYSKNDFSSLVHVVPTLSCPNNQSGIYAKAYQILP